MTDNNDCATAKTVFPLAQRICARMNQFARKRQAIEEQHVNLRSRDSWNILSFDITQVPYMEITQHSTALSIRDRIVSGEWTAELVMRCMCRAAYVAHKQTHCLTEILFDRAMEKARALDEEFRKSGPRGMLHGVPISVKDHVNVAGYDTTAGCSQYGLKPVQTDSVMTAILEEQGAIVYVKTNIPQSMMTFECNNTLFGRTTNPYNHDLTPGGSSGGEGALIALFGSCLGLGSDIGGSLRIPAHFCGIYALKPSFGRLPLEGNLGGNGQHEIMATLGPMARSIDDLELFMEACLAKEPWLRDTSAMKFPFEKFMFPEQQKLKIGYYEEDGFTPAMPPCRRAVRMVVDKLRMAGHVVVPFVIPEILEAVKMTYRIFCADGLQAIREKIGSDPLDSQVSKVFMASRVPRWVKRSVAQVLKWSGEPNADFLPCLHGSSVSELWKVQQKRFEYVQRFRKQFRTSGIDFLVCPGFAHPAVPHNSFGDLSFIASYTFFYNFVNFSVGTLPVTKVDQELDREMPLSSYDGFLAKQSAKYYKAKVAHGVPVGVQITAGYYEDEKTLAAMRVVERCLNDA